MSQPKISVIIPVRNEAEKIDQCLEAVFAQSLKPYEVIVVDGHSNDGTVEKARKFPAKILYENSNSIAQGRQIGVENAEGEYVAFTDADCIVDKDWLANLLKEFDYGIIGVGGGIKNAERSFWEKSINLGMATFMGGANTIQGRFFEDKRFVSSISGCNSMYRKEDIVRIGGFNTKLPGGEDLELNKRLSKIGKLLYTPEAVVLHQHNWTLKKFAKKMCRYGRERGMIRAWNIQIIPAVIAPLLALSLIFTRWIFISMLGFYLLLLIIMGLKFAVRERDIRYQVSIPLAYFIEHVVYSLGIWKGLIFRR